MREFGEKLDGVEYLRRPGSYAVIIENDRVGVIESKRLGKYFLVGGAIEAGETEIEALQREAREEIGFEIEVLEKLGVAVEYFYAEIDGEYFAKECHFYHVRLLEKIKDAENDLLWINRGELGAMYHRSHEWIVRRELSRLKKR